MEAQPRPFSPGWYGDCCFPSGRWRCPIVGQCGRTGQAPADLFLFKTTEPALRTTAAAQALLDRRQGQGLVTRAVSIVNRVPPFGVGQHQRLGDALTAAQKAYAQTGMMPELVGVYHRLGDPAMKIR